MRKPYNQLRKKERSETESILAIVFLHLCVKFSEIMNQIKSISPKLLLYFIIIIKKLRGLKKAPLDKVSGKK